ncbi:MAG: nitroreductase family protein [Erysipelotrichaceae bacterium]|nr:nitroreductase family protein [Erysipelotrichaceae bacterium]
MEKDLYDQIFRRKSYHTFRERSNEAITQSEIEDIYDAYKSFDKLFDIKTDIKIEKDNNGSIIRNSEYIIKIFSEKKDGYLQNVGYIGEQLDLYLFSKNIGALWFGIAKSSEVYNDLNYVILIAIAKVDSYRKDMFKAKRKDVEEIWSGADLNIANIVRFAPSACNSQPWHVENKDNNLYVYRKSKSGKVGIMPKDASIFYNQIDIGIFMCFLELCLMHEEIIFDKELFKDNQEFDAPQLNAIYKLK